MLQKEAGGVGSTVIWTDLSCLFLVVSDKSSTLEIVSESNIVACVKMSEVSDDKGCEMMNEVSE